MNSTYAPRSVLNLYHRSLIILPLRCPACGGPFMVGGPSMNLDFFLSLTDSSRSDATSVSARYPLTRSSMRLASNF